MANSVIFKNVQTELPELDQDNPDTFTVFVTFRKADRKTILEENPDAIVMSAEFLKAGKTVTFKEYTKTFIIEGLEEWESGEVEGLDSINVMIIAPAFIEDNANGEKALNDLKSYFKSLGCQSEVKIIPAGKNLQQVIDQDDSEKNFHYDLSPTKAAGGSEPSRGSGQGDELYMDSRTRLQHGGQPDFLLQRLNEAVEKEQDGTFYILPGGEMGNVVYDDKRKKYKVVNYSSELISLKLTKWVYYVNSKGPAG